MLVRDGLGRVIRDRVPATDMSGDLKIFVLFRIGNWGDVIKENSTNYSLHFGEGCRQYRFKSGR